jgi:hypothetical protein
MSAPAADFDPAAFVKGLTDEQKDEVFFAIVREVLGVYSRSGSIPIQPDGEELLGHLLTPLGVRELTAKYGPECLPEWEVPPGQRSTVRGVTSEELWARIDAMEAERAAQSQSRAAG